MSELLSAEQEQAMFAEMDGQGASAPPSETASAPASVEPQATKEEYEEEISSPPAAETKTEIPQTLRLKVQGQEMDVPLFVDGKINPLLVERTSMGEDYHRKTMALAEERRKAEAVQRESQARLVQLQEELEKAKTEIGKKSLPQLPDDDPYAQVIKSTREEAAELRKMIQQQQQWIAQQQETRRIEESKAALQRKEAELKEQYKLDDREIHAVESEWLRRYQAGEPVKMEDVAKDRVAYLESLKQKAISEWKEKHRRNVPAAPDKAAVTGTSAPELNVRSEGFLDMIREKLSASK